MIYKSIDSNDIFFNKFYTYKSWKISSLEFSNYGIIIQEGIKNRETEFSYNDSKNPDGTYKRLIWDSINNLYYKSGSEFEYSSFHNYIESSKFFDVKRNIGNNIKVINIPSLLYGEKIKFNSLLIKSNSINILDDGNYNLYISGSNPIIYVGNVFYDSGQIIFTNNLYFNILNFFELNFKSVLLIEEIEVYCNVKYGEFNYTWNPTALKSGSLTEYNDIFVSSSFNPLITTIGLYDDNNDLLAVGKFAKPIKRDYELDTIFLIKIDI